MTPMNDEVTKLLQKLGYVPIVQKVEDGCILRLPEQTQAVRRKPAVTKGYGRTFGAGGGVTCYTSLPPSRVFLPMEEYATRLFILADIMEACSRSKIDSSLLVFQGEDGRPVEGMKDVLDPPADEGERAKDGFLIQLFHQAVALGFPEEFEAVAVDHGVYEGYRLCRYYHPTKESRDR